MRQFDLGPSGEMIEVKSAVSSMGILDWAGGMFSDAIAGSWQRHMRTESTQNLMRFSAVYACVSLISSDVSKLSARLMRRDERNRIWTEVEAGSPFLPVLAKPNHYQTTVQFLALWVTMKLLHGNAYVYKERDARGVVTGLYVLDSRFVLPLVAPNGEVFYQLRHDELAQVGTEPSVPASEIMHDRMNTFWHQLCGVSPIYACAYSATQGVRIQNNSEAFFRNMSRPSGMLTAPAAIDDIVAARLKRDFESAYGGTNIGRLFVAGSNLKYEPMTIPAQDAQLIEQLKWTTEDVARAFGVPLYKISAGAYPNLTNIGALKQDYLDTCLQTHITAIESLMNDGLGLNKLGLKVDLDENDLLRMDALSRAEINDKKVKSGTMTPNEARAQEDLPPVEGGHECYLQQQNYSLAALAKRDAKEDPFATNKPDTPALPKPGSTDEDLMDVDDDELDEFESHLGELLAA